MSGGGRSGLAMALGVAGGLGLAGTSLAAWVEEVAVSDVAGVPIEQPELTLGVELAGAALPLGVVAAVLALGLVARSGGARRLLGAALVAVGAGGGVAVALGLAGGAGADGELTTAAYAAPVAALAVLAAGGLAVCRAPPPPALPPRYDLDGDDEDAEWDAASVEDPEWDAGGVEDPEWEAAGVEDPEWDAASVEDVGGEAGPDDDHGRG